MSVRELTIKEHLESAWRQAAGPSIIEVDGTCVWTIESADLFRVRWKAPGDRWLVLEIDAAELNLHTHLVPYLRGLMIQKEAEYG